VTDAAPSATNINPWLHPVAGGEPPPLTERLVRALEAHSAASAADIVTCRQLTQRLADPVVEMLVGMIVDDEQRHDLLLLAMIRRLQAETELAASPGALPALSTAAHGTVESATQAVADVRGLIRNEHDGSRHLRHLARQEPTLYGGLYPLLLETIARDSEKHATILRYLLHQLEERTR
jgi:rubrerythrin